MNTLVRFFKDESGATMVEYALMVALVAIAVAATVILVGNELNSTFNDVIDCLATPADCPPAPTAE